VAHPLQAVRVSTAGAPSPSLASAVGSGEGAALDLTLIDWPALCRAPRLDSVGPLPVTASPREEEAAPETTGRKVARVPQPLPDADGSKDSDAKGATPVDAAPLQVLYRSPLQHSRAAPCSCARHSVPLSTSIGALLAL
jgi:hypothetical protein